MQPRIMTTGHYHMTSIGQTKRTVSNFRDDVLNSAVSYIFPFTTTGKRYNSRRKMKIVQIV